MSTPALKTNPKIIFFTDWDGTVTLQDSNDFLVDNLGLGTERRKQFNKDCMNGKVTFRDSFREMMDSVKEPFDQCVEYLFANVKLDPGFKEFYLWTKDNNVPVVVLSSGMEQIIHALLEKLIGPEAKDLTVIANKAKLHDDGTWDVEFRDETDHGHDKSRTIKPYAEREKRPILLYAGDGVSDLSAARETDLLFAKKGCDLVEYCEREKIPFTEFGSFSDILKRVKELYADETTIDRIVGK